MITFLSESSYENSCETAIKHKKNYRTIDIISLVPKILSTELSSASDEEAVSLLSLEKSLLSADISGNYESCVVFLKEDITSRINKIVFDTGLQDSSGFLHSSKIYIPEAFEYNTNNFREYTLKFYLGENYRKILLESGKISDLTINPTRGIQNELNIILNDGEFGNIPFINTVSLNYYLLMLNYLSSGCEENITNI